MNNKTFSLFISSTFSDFIEERVALKKIFYEIDDYCQSRGYDFQIIDLRWGVNTEAALNQKTIEICLEEVKRYCTLSPRPNFLLMVGERYGWVPLPSKIEKKNTKNYIAPDLLKIKQFLMNGTNRMKML